MWQLWGCLRLCVVKMSISNPRAPPTHSTPRSPPIHVNWQKSNQTSSNVGFLLWAEGFDFMIWGLWCIFAVWSEGFISVLNVGGLEEVPLHRRNLTWKVFKWLHCAKTRQGSCTSSERPCVGGAGRFRFSTSAFFDRGTHVWFGFKGETVLTHPPVTVLLYATAANAGWFPPPNYFPTCVLSEWLIKIKKSRPSSRRMFRISSCWWRIHLQPGFLPLLQVNWNRVLKNQGQHFQPSYPN